MRKCETYTFPPRFWTIHGVTVDGEPIRFQTEHEAYSFRKVCRNWTREKNPVRPLTAEEASGAR